EKIEEMRGAADGRGLFRRDPAKAEIVEFEWEQGRIAGADQGFADDLFDSAGQGGDGDGIPNLEQQRFRPVREPVELGVGVLDGDESVVTLDDGAFLDGTNAQRETAAMFGI